MQRGGNSSVLKGFLMSYIHVCVYFSCFFSHLNSRPLWNTLSRQSGSPSTVHASLFCWQGGCLIGTCQKANLCLLRTVWMALVWLCWHWAATGCLTTPRLPPLFQCCTIPPVGHGQGVMQLRSLGLAVNWREARMRSVSLVSVRHPLTG